MADQDFNPYAAPSREADYEIGRPADVADGILATPWQRWLGVFLDNLLFVPAVIPFLLLAATLEEERIEEIGPMALLFGPMLVVTIVQWFLIARNGQSIGKRIIRTRIVRLDGSNPGFVYGVLLRSWVLIGLQFIPLLGYFIGLADALFVFRRDRRTIHDHIAGTKVIQV